MRYRINFDKLVNRLVPYYLGGRKLILYLQSCVQPLQAVNESFSQWAKETRIEAAMTSQIFKFEWFLNRKFRVFFDDPNAAISLRTGTLNGTAIFHQNAVGIPDEDQFLLYFQSEDGEVVRNTVLFLEGEETENTATSFVVVVPKLKKGSDGRLIDGLTEEDFYFRLKYWIDRYRLATKTYQIIIKE